MRSKVARASSGSLATSVRPALACTAIALRSLPTTSWTSRAIRTRSQRGGLAGLRGAQLRQPRALVADLDEQALLLAQQVGEQQRDADHADVGHELERAERLARRVRGANEASTSPASVNAPSASAVRRSVR